MGHSYTPSQEFCTRKLQYRFSLGVLRKHNNNQSTYKRGLFKLVMDRMEAAGFAQGLVYFSEGILTSARFNVAVEVTDELTVSWMDIEEAIMTGQPTPSFPDKISQGGSLDNYSQAKVQDRRPSDTLQVGVCESWSQRTYAHFLCTGSYSTNWRRANLKANGKGRKCVLVH
jgi:hypothetical protein